MPPEAAATEIGSPPSPHGGWSQDCVALARALVVPPISSGTVQDCGVLDRDGAFCEHAVTWRGQRPMMTPPDGPVEPAASLKGRYLFAGQIWAHFGHFLAESMSRLWALDHINNDLDGIVFIPKRPADYHDLKRYQKEFLHLLGITLPIHILDVPTEVEELIVPGQGFGLGAIAAGSEKFRAYIGAHFARDVAPAGDPAIYLSRTRLGGLEGSVVCEDMLERNLEREGYTPYHPQKHTITNQIAQYKAAKQVIGLDGSAFHLFAFAGNRTKDIAIVLRRNSNVYSGLLTHIAGFTGAEPHVISALNADWIPENKDRPGRYSFGQLDFEDLRAELIARAMIPGNGRWEVPRFRDVKREMAAFSQRKGILYQRSKTPRLAVPAPTAEAAQ